MLRGVVLPSLVSTPMGRPRPSMELTEPRQLLLPAPMEPEPQPQQPHAQELGLMADTAAQTSPEASNARSAV